MKRTTKPRRVFRLSDEEARVLQQIFRNVGGDPYTSPRGIVDKLYSRLASTFGCMDRHTSNGSIFFLTDGRY